MAFWLPFLALSGGGLYADHKWNESKLRSAGGNALGSAFDKSTDFVAEQASEAGRQALQEKLEEAGMGKDSAFGKFIDDNWGKMAGMVGTLGALMASPLPGFLKQPLMLATVGVFVFFMAKEYLSDKANNDFKTASSADASQRSLANVPKPGDENYVAQKTRERFALDFIKSDGPEAEPA